MTHLMNPNPELSERDAELLSAYLDTMLTDDERRDLENRLQEDAFLRAELRAMRQTVTMLHDLPILKAPRNLTLPIDTVRAKPTPKLTVLPRRNAPLWFSAAAAFAVIVFGAVLVLPRLTNSQADMQGVAAMPSPNAEVMMFSASEPAPPAVADGIVGAVAGDGQVNQAVEEVSNTGMDATGNNASSGGAGSDIIGTMPILLASPAPEMATTMIEPTIDTQARTMETSSSEPETTTMAMQTSPESDQNDTMMEMALSAPVEDAPSLKRTADVLVNFLFRILFVILRGILP